MVLFFKQLSKRDVVNVADGKCFGKITDLSISFPKGTLTGITVPLGKRKWFFKRFDRNVLFIPERDILKIGGDVILVDVKCGETCETSVDLNPPKVPPKPPAPPKKPCGAFDPCAPIPPCPSKNDGLEPFNRIDLGDY